MRKTLIVTVVLALSVMVVPVAAATELGAAELTIVRADYGVPHVYADELGALYHGMGYVAADDRLWQAEILRRSATGTLAEFFGPEVVAQDIEARTLFGPVERRAAELAAAPEHVQEIFASYVDGINHRIQDELDAGELPPEFAAVGPPRPWTVDDSLAVAMLLGSQFGWFGSEELSNLSLWNTIQDRLGADAAVALGDLFWLDDPDAFTTNPGGQSRATRGKPPASAFDADTLGAAGAALASRAAAERARAAVGFDVNGPASNAMVLSGRMTKTGKPLLLGGPQMGYSTPQINHEIGLHGAGYDVVGMTIAGYPLVPIGVGDGYAWTLTSGGSDNTDIFAEQLDPADPSRYLFDGEYRSMDCRNEEIGVAGSEPVVRTLCTTVHGPVVGSHGSVAFSLQNTTFGQELESFAAWSALSTARGIGDFEAVLPDMAYNFNLLYADRRGNIAYWHIGHIPVRADHVNPFFPTPGTGEAEWQGVLPFSENPQVVNPARGWMASWNNKPEAGWENSTTGFWMWGPAHRVQTLANQLDRLRPRSAGVRTLERINRVGGHTTDTPTGTADTVFVSTDLALLLSQVDVTADPRLEGVVHSLRRWNQLQIDHDNDGFYDSPWGGVFNEWWFELADQAFGEVTDVVDRSVLGNLVDRLLRGDGAALPLRYDWLGGGAVSDTVTRSLVDALDELAARYGSPDPDDWDQPISTIDWDPLPLTPGVGSTVWMNRGTYNQIVSLTGRVSAENVIAPGQSGDPTSAHFADQLGLYANWEYKPMRLTERDVLAHAESVTTLEVPVAP